MHRPGTPTTAAIQPEKHSAISNPSGRKKTVYTHLGVALVIRRVLPPPRGRERCHLWARGARSTRPRRG
eukprot:14783908-Alexandrium_andersonii.AAC.1